MVEPSGGQIQRSLEVCMTVIEGNLARDLVVIPRYVPRTARSEFGYIITITLVEFTYIYACDSMLVELRCI